LLAEKAQDSVSGQTWQADQDRCLDTLTFGLIGACRLAEWTIAISLRNTAANAAKRSDAKLSSAGDLNQRTKKFSEVAADVANGPCIGSIVTTG
jgi:hypothetical protein